MADSIVSFLLANVTQLLKQEVSLPPGVRNQVSALHQELTQIHKFLRNSEHRRELVKDLVSQIRDVANEAEDVMDTFVVNLAKHKRRNTLGKFWHGGGHATMLRSVEKQVLTIKKEIAAIYKNKDKYEIENKDIDDHSEKRRAAVRERRRHVEEDEVVSYVKNAMTVMKQLCKGGPNREVASIIGMGGLGKTTLAKKIYSDGYIRNRFKTRAWVYVSQEFQTRDLLLNILQLVTLSTGEIYKMDDAKLAKELNSCLQGKKYLIVLDDVWDNKAWNGIKEAFPDNGNGSRILITTRLNEVASYASSVPPYHLPLLNKEDSWELFSKKAFQTKVFPHEYEKDGKHIAEKSNGLPLAIVVAAGLLAKRDKSTDKDKSLLAWSQMATNVSWYLKRDPGNCLDVLALSYEELPPHLKSCYLYFGVFPEDFEISTRQLIRLWIAEGFVEQHKSRNIEDVAEEYLEELIDRSLIMVMMKRSDGGVKSCRIHDLLRELCIKEGIHENFLAVHTDQVFSPSSSSTTSTTSTTKHRRISLHCSTSRYISSTPCDSSRVRSLVCFGEPGKLRTFNALEEAFPLLRMLDLGSKPVTGDNISVESLTHLRYLRMNAPSLVDIPSSISDLPNLETLDLRESRIMHLKPNFWKMQKLKHLFIAGSCTVPYYSLRDATTMRNLQTLSTVSPHMFSALKFTDIFPNVTKLGILESSIYSWTRLPQLKYIQTLKINYTVFEPVNPNAVSLSLTKITLIESAINSTNFAMLAKVPNLQVLKLLKHSVAGSSIEIKEGWFEKLQVLHMVELPVAKWTIEKGAMQGLQFLFISQCPNLNVVPEELKQVSTLTNIKATWCSSRLEKSLRALGDHIQYEFRGYKPGGWGNDTA